MLAQTNKQALEGSWRWTRRRGAAPWPASAPAQRPHSSESDPVTFRLQTGGNGDRAGDGGRRGTAPTPISYFPDPDEDPPGEG